MIYRYRYLCKNGDVFYSPWIDGCAKKAFEELKAAINFFPARIINKHDLEIIFVPEEDVRSISIETQE